MSRPIYHSSVQCIIKKDNKILLLKRQNTNFGNNKYALPGGHLEYTEDIQEGMARELYEEVGLNIKEDDLHLYKIIKMVDAKGEQTEYTLGAVAKGVKVILTSDITVNKLTANKKDYAISLKPSA